MKSPIKSAYRDGVRNRLLSMIYAALNEAVPLKSRRKFRKEWSEKGSYRLAEVLLNCAKENWPEYPDTFWMDPWIGASLREHEPADLCYVIDSWLVESPLPPAVSDDPYVEDAKLRELAKLFSALNR